MKKLLLTIGTITSVISPMATTIACGRSDGEYISGADKNIVSLDKEELLNNPNRYIDFEAKELLGDNIEEDGYNNILTTLSELKEDPVFELVDEEFLINTDMNIPSGLYGSWIFQGLTLNNEVVIASEAINHGYDNDYLGGNSFKGSTLKNGVKFADDLKYIRDGSFEGANIEKIGYPDFKISLPIGIEVIGNFAFANIETDVINYDFSHLVNGGIDSLTGIFTSNPTAGSAWFEGKDITLPFFTEFDVNSSVDRDDHDRTLFGYDPDNNEGPNLIKYKSEEDGTLLELRQIIPYNEIHDVQGTNIY